jgi:hypothetical protein
MRYKLPWHSGLILCVLAACAGQESTAPTSPMSPRQPSLDVSKSSAFERPPFNLEIVLGGSGFGMVKFRQPNDGSRIVYLETWVRDLAPNTSYVLQRAVDANVDGDCTSTTWVTLGKGTTPQVITTDSQGTGRQGLYRSLAAVAPGTKFDIHFQVVDATTSSVVMTSSCYQFTVR